MESIRTPYLKGDQVPANFTPIRVEITAVEGRVVLETVWVGPTEPIQPEDVPY